MGRLVVSASESNRERYKLKQSNSDFLIMRMKRICTLGNLLTSGSSFLCAIFLASSDVGSVYGQIFKGIGRETPGNDSPHFL